MISAPEFGDANTSYCGLHTVITAKRADAPPRHDPVCERCAVVCGFQRRPGRKRSGRTRGSRRLGTVTERLEIAVDALESFVQGLRDAAAVRGDAVVPGIDGMVVDHGEGEAEGEGSPGGES